MTEETRKRIAELEAQLTPRGAYEAIRWGASTPEGRRFAEAWEQIRALEGKPVREPLKAA